MANGILVIDKSAGWTSQDVAAKLRGVFHERRVGHGGTLDPMATGVLPIFIGRATRAAEFLESAEKEYIAGLRLGTVTDTQDTSGTVLETHPVTVTRADVQAALQRFLGPIEQIPPMYSALKVNGKKLYELAREGKTIERKSRKVQIKYRAWLKTSQTPIPHVLLFLPDYRTMKRRKIQSIGKKLENP